MHTSKCGVYHKASLECPQQEGTEQQGDLPSAAAPSVAELYGAALREARLGAGHILDFGHAQQLIFAGLEPDQRRGRQAREAGQMVVA